MVADRKQVNLPDDCIEILEYFAKELAIPGLKDLNQPDTIRRMASELGYKPKKKKK